MSKIALEGNASGTGTLTIAAPNTSTDRTLTLPDESGTVVLDSATQTLTNKTIQGGTITSGTAVASTSGTSIDFTGIPSWVKRITVMFNNVSTNGTSYPLVQLGDAGGIANSGYFSMAGNISTSSTATAVYYTSGFGAISANSTNSMAAQLIFSNISGNTWLLCGTLTQNTNNLMFLAGRKTISGTLTQVRITTVNGTDTFDAGTINILYE